MSTKSDRRHRIHHGLETISFIGAQVKSVLWKHLVYEERNSPDIALRMVNANGQDGMVALNDFPCAAQCVMFGTLYIHFDKRQGCVCEELVDGCNFYTYSLIGGF